MRLNDVQLDGIVYNVIRECSEGKVHVTRDTICQLVLDHLKLHVMEYVLPSISRLEVAEKIVADRDSTQGRPHIYYLPQKGS